MNFTIASTPRAFDVEPKEWVDGQTQFLPAHIWRGAAENAAASLFKGMRVIATGELKSRSYATKTGEERTVLELDVEEIGPSLRYARAAVRGSSRAAADAAEEERRSEEIHPVDRFSLSARRYTEEDLWFGMDANPAGDISTTHPQEPEPAPSPQSESAATLTPEIYAPGPARYQGHSNDA